MQIFKWKKKDIIKKNINFLSDRNIDLKFSIKNKALLKDIILYAQKICPELLFDEYKKIAEKSSSNTMELFNWMLLDSLRLNFEKQTTFGCMKDISLNKKALFGTTLQTHSKKMSIFKIKNRDISFSGAGESIFSLKFAINESGFCISNHKIYSNIDGNGLTPGLIIRLLVERYSTVRSAINFLSSIPHSTCSSYFLFDKNEMAIVETSPKIIKLIFPEKYYLSLTNHFISQELVNFDKKSQIFPSNTSIQRDSHAVFLIMRNKHKLDINIFKTILNNRNGNIASDEGDFTTNYSIIYEQDRPYFLLADGCFDKSKIKKIKIS